MKSVLIIGNNPLKEDLMKQYQALGADRLSVCDYDALANTAIADFDEFFILSPEAADAVASDALAMEALNFLTRKLPPSDGQRPRLHLMLQSSTSLRMLQLMDFPADVNAAFDIHPFTMEDVWAKNVLVRLPGQAEGLYPTIDRVRIDSQSQSHVHVVISGFSAQAEAIALHVALVGHYPNYRPTDPHPLRTRITIVEEGICARRDAFVARYQNLFTHSFYRTISPNSRSTRLHRPLYNGRRTDFVDVEWEFVDASISHPEVVRKIESWVAGQQQLTFFICHNDDGENLSEAMSLPRIVYEKQLPVIVRQQQHGLAESFSRSAVYSSVHVFGMRHCGYDVTLPLVGMARYLKYFYDCSYGQQGVPTELPAREVEEAWQSEKSFAMRFSNIYNVMMMSTKMRSLGHSQEDADTFYALTQEEIQGLAETEHNRWSVERLIQGARPCTDAEIEEIRQDVKRLKKAYKMCNIHFDLRAYQDLEDDGTGRNAQVYDYDLTACIPLIVKTFCEQHNHGR